LSVAHAGGTIDSVAARVRLPWEVGSLRIVLFLALLANSADLVATAVGIHLLGNREGNPLLAGLAHGNWWAFVLVKGLLVPVLIWRLDTLRSRSPVVASAGLAMVLVVLTVAVGQWVGWIAGVLRVSRFPL
jgi:uncharacterized membrane protein